MRLPLRAWERGKEISYGEGKKASSANLRRVGGSFWGEKVDGHLRKGKRVFRVQKVKRKWGKREELTQGKRRFDRKKGGPGKKRRSSGNGESKEESPA